VGGGEETPSEPESSGDDDVEEDEDEEEGEITPSLHSSLLKTSPHMVNLLASKRGTLLVRTR
jgi:hypothetical protein